MEVKPKMVEKLLVRTAYACIWGFAAMSLSLAAFFVAHMIGLA
jgi:hypothetical protein